MGRITQASFSIDFNHIVRDNEDLKNCGTVYIHVQCNDEFILTLTGIIQYILEILRISDMFTVLGQSIVMSNYVYL